MTDPKELIARARQCADNNELEAFDLYFYKLADALEAALARLALAETVCEAAKDMQHSLEHYEWCDKVKARQIRREIPPGECDCGVLEFKCAVAAWRTAKEAKP